ncbi:MAG: RNA-guided endonuclease InsQ/TnpB family protein, partial [Parachlamydiaceae bacterium]
SGSWHVVFSCEVDVLPLPEIDKAVGIDVGLENFATLTDGKVIPNPRFYKRSEKVLAKEQRKLSKLTKGTPERRKQGKRLAKVHEKISNRRRDFCHKLSKKIVHEYQYICIEDLNIKKMVQDNYLAKGIHDASWNQFRQFLSYKAVEAGRKIGIANTAYTSQECSKCHQREHKSLSQRRHICSKCGYQATRDFNASENILAIGLDGLGVIPRSLRL